MIFTLLATFVWILPAQGQDLSFKEAYQTKVMGIDSLGTEDLEIALKKALDYATYRKFPKSSAAKEIWQSCLDHPESNVLCEIVLKTKEEKTSTPAPKEIRTKLFQALLSLDTANEREQKCPEALKVFQSVIQDQALYAYHPRALYWSWICEKLANKKENAQIIKERLWSEFPLSHHTMRVLEQDKDSRVDEILKDDKDFAVKLHSEKTPELNPWIEAIEALQKQGEDGAAAVVASHINIRIRDLEPEVRLYLAVLMSQVAESIPSVLPMPRVLLPLILESREHMTPSTLKLLFPLNYNFEKVANEKATILELVNQYRGKLDASLFIGLIHLESAFNPRASSKANAFGLTQMLVDTASDQLKKKKNDPNAKADQALLFQPRMSVELGAMDFRWRMGEFKNDVILTLASYNAGVAGVKKWQQEVKKIQSPEILTDILFLNRATEMHVSQYVSMILTRADWYAKLYPELKVR